MAFQPLAVDALGAVVGVRAIEQDDAVRKWAITQQAQQVALGAPGFGKDDGLFGAAEFTGFGKGNVQGLEQCFALGVVIDTGRKLREAVQVSDFAGDGFAIFRGEGCTGFVLGPLLSRFVECFVVLAQFLVERLGWLLLFQLALEAVGHGGQRAGNGEGGRGQKLAQHQRHQRARAGGQRLQVVALQVIGNELIETVFAFFRGELFHQREALGVGDIGRDLTAQGAMANGFEPRLQRLENLFLIEIGKLFAEALRVAKHVLVDEADQTKQFQQGVLQRRGGKQKLVAAGQCHLQGIGDDVAGLVDVAKPMCFVDDDQIPRYGVYIGCLAAGKLIRADDDLGRIEWAKLPLSDSRVVGLGFENATGQEEFLGQFLEPLLTQVRWRDDQNASLALSPLLRKHQPGFNGFTQAHFVCQQRALR